jgi:hypothetical protein
MAVSLLVRSFKPVKKRGPRVLADLRVVTPTVGDRRSRLGK